ncbi:hypothetical protein B0I37DRAFT_373925 [Chaetomium sp. MPI-CAGE-AT-0009]|nr:hypothetical protein B0I37DRAFT_373925 [Chaetomium sp. MPI-CAGE-AT-0009]
MAYNATPSSGTPPVPPSAESRQYTPYRPPGQQQQQQAGHHLGGLHGFQPPQQPQHISQHNYQPLPQQAGDLPSAMASMTIDGVTPAPLRLQRKPVASPGILYEGPPVTQTQTPQPQSPPPAHPQPGYFPLPTPAPSPYVANAQAHPPPPQQYGSYYPPQYPASPPLQQWHGAPAYAAPAQPNPPALYEMESPPSNAAFHTLPPTSDAPPIPPKVSQPVQNFIAELEGSGPPGHSGGQDAVAEVSPPTSDPDPKPSASQDSEVTQVVAEPGSVTDSTSDPPTQSPEAKPPQDPHPEGTGSDSSPAVADSEGLIVVEKPGPPDHEGLIPFHATTLGPVSTTLQPGDIHPSAKQPTPSPPCPEPNANVAHQWPWHPSLNGPNPQNHVPLNQSSQSPASASPTASLHLQNGTPASNPTPGPSQSPATATPPPAPLTPPTAGHPTSRPHSTTFSTSHSHSPSPTLQESQTVTPATTVPPPPPPPPPPPNPQQGSFAAQAPSYTPAAFPSKHLTFPAQAAPSTQASANTPPASHPSAIPSTPSITSSQHSFAPPPQPHTSKPGKHSGASTSFGGFANSVFSKDTVKWSKKTASRFGGAIKTAATTAHAAATNAQTAASQAAALHRQKSFAAAQMKASSGSQGAGANAKPTTTTSGQSQPLSSTAGIPAPAAVPIPPAYGQQRTNSAPIGTHAVPTGMGSTAPQGQGPPGWSSGAAAGSNMGNGTRSSGMPAQAGTGPQPGPPPGVSTGTEPQTAQSPQNSPGPSPNIPQGVGQQMLKPDTPQQHNEPGRIEATASPPPAQVPGGQPIQPGQFQPSYAGGPNPQAAEGQPPQPSAGFPSPGYYQGPGGGAACPYAYGQHSQIQPSGYASPPGPSPATPAPGVMGQPVGWQPPQQYPPPVNVASQQPIWNSGSPPPEPAAGQGAPGQPPYAQQPWGQTPGQSWAPPPHGAPGYAPGPNHPPQHGAGFQPTQYEIPFPQPQYATPQPPPQQPSPWPAPNVAPYSAPIPDPAAPTWQQQPQPPPQWHAPPQQHQQGWGPPQPVPSPYPQANHYPQPAGAWDPATQQPQQPWSHPQ